MCSFISTTSSADNDDDKETHVFISTTSSAENETERRDVDNVVLGVGSRRLNDNETHVGSRRLGGQKYLFLSSF